MWLITSDIHLSDRPKDAYRFGLFPWLAKQQERHNVSATFILGDLTENKDKHSSQLVNKVVDGLRRLRAPVYLLRGNHDGNDPTTPFFRFLRELDGLHFSIVPEVIKVPTGLQPRHTGAITTVPVTMIPHCRTQAEFDEACKLIPANCSAVMLHNTFEGAIAETGAHLSGLRASLGAFNGAAGVWAGDVHKPQQVGPVTYVGSPYHVRFGDNYTPGVLLMGSVAPNKLRFPAPSKWSLTIRDPSAILTHRSLKEGDQIKLTVELGREELVEWSAVRKSCLQACQRRGLENYGIELKLLQSEKRPDVQSTEEVIRDKTQLFEAYCQRERLPSAVREAGRAILNEV